MSKTLTEHLKEYREPTVLWECVWEVGRCGGILFTKEDYFAGGHYLTDTNDDNIEMINDWQNEKKKQIRECFEELKTCVTEDYFVTDELKEFRRRIDELKRRTDEVVQIDELKRRVNGFKGILVELEDLGEDLHDAL